jgi:hypothetical protein
MGDSRAVPTDRADALLRAGTIAAAALAAVLGEQRTAASKSTTRITQRARRLTRQTNVTRSAGRVAGAAIVMVAAIVSTAAACSRTAAPPGGSPPSARPTTARAIPPSPSLMPTVRQLPTGRQLRILLLPPSSFPAGSHVDGKWDSGSTPINGPRLAKPNILEDVTSFGPCTALGSNNFRQVAYAVDQMTDPAKELFQQQINQFPTPIAATQYFSKYYSDFASCAPRFSGGNFGQSSLTVQQSTVDGYHAFTLTYYIASNGQAPIADVALLTVDDGSAVLLESWESGDASTDPAAAIAALEPRITALIANVAKTRR